MILVILLLVGIASYAYRRMFWVSPAILKMIKFSVFVFLLIPVYIIVLLYTPIASSHQVEVVFLDSPINVNGLQRFLPLMTAYVYASDRIQIPIHRVYPEDTYVYFIDGRSIYNWVIEPEGFWS